MFEKILENAAKEQAADLDQPERGSSEGEAGAVHQGAAHISLHRAVHRAGPDQEDVRGKVLSDGGRKRRPLEVQRGKEKTAGEVRRTRTVAEEKRKQYLEIWQQKKAVDKNKKNRILVDRYLYLIYLCMPNEKDTEVHTRTHVL